MSDKIRVAITGPLSQPRKAVAQLINSTQNATYVDSVTFDTHYLVCAKADSKKAKKAARLGTAVISELELLQYLSDSVFPDTELPQKPTHYANNFPEIAWDSVDPDPQVWVLGYEDARGNQSIRSILITGLGHSVHDPDTRWVGGYDGPTFKTWRRDRIKFLVRPEEMVE
jgi:hypothetical protein